MADGSDPADVANLNEQYDRRSQLLKKLDEILQRSGPKLIEVLGDGSGSFGQLEATQVASGVKKIVSVTDDLQQIRTTLEKSLKEAKSTFEQKSTKNDEDHAKKVQALDDKFDLVQRQAEQFDRDVQELSRLRAERLSHQSQVDGLQGQVQALEGIKTAKEAVDEQLTQEKHETQRLTEEVQRLNEEVARLRDVINDNMQAERDELTSQQADVAKMLGLLKLEDSRKDKDDLVKARADLESAQKKIHTLESTDSQRKLDLQGERHQHELTRRKLSDMTDDRDKFRDHDGKLATARDNALTARDNAVDEYRQLEQSSSSEIKALKQRLKELEDAVEKHDTEKFEQFKRGREQGKRDAEEQADLKVRAEVDKLLTTLQQQTASDKSSASTLSALKTTIDNVQTSIDSREQARTQQHTRVEDLFNNLADHLRQAVQAQGLATNAAVTQAGRQIDRHHQYMQQIHALEDRRGFYGNAGMDSRLVLGDIMLLYNNLTAYIDATYNLTAQGVVAVGDNVTRRIDNLPRPLTQDDVEQAVLNADLGDNQFLSTLATSAQVDDGNANINQRLDDLDTAVESRAAQATIDTVSNDITSLDTSITNRLTNLDTAVNSRASQQTVDAANTIITNNLANLDASVASRAAQQTVDAVSNNITNRLDSLNAAVADRASQATVDAAGNTMTNLLGGLSTAIDTRASQQTLDAASTNIINLLAGLGIMVSSRASQQTVDAANTSLTNSLTTLNTTVGTRASDDTVTAVATDLADLLDALSTAVNTRASEATLNTITGRLGDVDTAIGTRASQDSVDGSAAAVADLASQLEDIAAGNSLEELRVLIWEALDLLRVIPGVAEADTAFLLNLLHDHFRHYPETPGAAELQALDSALRQQYRLPDKRDQPDLVRQVEQLAERAGTLSLGFRNPTRGISNNIEGASWVPPPGAISQAMTDRFDAVDRSIQEVKDNIAANALSLYSGSGQSSPVRGDFPQDGRPRSTSGSGRGGEGRKRFRNDLIPVTRSGSTSPQFGPIGGFAGRGSTIVSLPFGQLPLGQMTHMDLNNLAIRHAGRQTGRSSSSPFFGPIRPDIRATIPRRSQSRLTPPPASTSADPANIASADPDYHEPTEEELQAAKAGKRRAEDQEDAELEDVAEPVLSTPDLIAQARAQHVPETLSQAALRRERLVEEENAEVNAAIGIEGRRKRVREDLTSMQGYRSSDDDSAQVNVAVVAVRDRLAAYLNLRDSYSHEVGAVRVARLLTERELSRLTSGEGRAAVAEDQAAEMQRQDELRQILSDDHAAAAYQRQIETNLATDAGQAREWSEQKLQEIVAAWQRVTHRADELRRSHGEDADTISKLRQTIKEGMGQAGRTHAMKVCQKVLREEAIRQLQIEEDRKLAAVLQARDVYAGIPLPDDQAVTSLADLTAQANLIVDGLVDLDPPPLPAPVAAGTPGRAATRGKQSGGTPATPRIPASPTVCRTPAFKTWANSLNIEGAVNLFRIPTSWSQNEHEHAMWELYSIFNDQRQRKGFFATIDQTDKGTIPTGKVKDCLTRKTSRLPSNPLKDDCIAHHDSPSGRCLEVDFVAGIQLPSALEGFDLSRQTVDGKRYVLRKKPTKAEQDAAKDDAHDDEDGGDEDGADDGAAGSG